MSQKVALELHGSPKRVVTRASTELHQVAFDKPRDFRLPAESNLEAAAPVLAMLFECSLIVLPGAADGIIDVLGQTWAAPSTGTTTASNMTRLNPCGRSTSKASTHGP